MKYLLPILLFTVIALAVPAPQGGASSPNFRFSVTRLDGSTPAKPEYLGVKDGLGVITNDTSKIASVYLDPSPRGMLYTSDKIPFYLLQTNDPTVYEFHCGGIPKVAGVNYTDFGLVDIPCSGACSPGNGKVLAYAPPKDGNRYLGQFRSYNVSGDQVLKFHTSAPPPGSDSVSVILIQETT
ncbi:hypothetical protein B9Z19DRAFT_963568 [Tuber borchii]|uniref:Uncharacterized protein n=1 Tax=Tuber borchii TaxID=42251 RepID=A0A2T7A6V0_TUBBO|nr:hypothetical protein B9Z19DRAFT_963568 [Tuber borchii]